MKSILYRFARLGGLICGYIWTVKIASAVHNCKNYFYSGLVKRRFSYFGIGSIVCWKCQFANESRISIGNNTYICGDGCITAWKGTHYDDGQKIITIGDNVQIGSSCHITAIKSVVIEDGCLIGKRVTITDNSHGRTDRDSLIIPPQKRELYSKGDVVIGRNVWIGDKATILPGVHIGENSIIGANSIVSSDLPSNCIYVNNGNKIIKQI